MSMARADSRSVEQNLAADGAIAWFSSNLSFALECCSRAAAQGRRYALHTPEEIDMKKLSVSCLFLLLVPALFAHRE
jgi:hypothetical protein